jgi:hypothetical protein
MLPHSTLPGATAGLAVGPSVLQHSLRNNGADTSCTFHKLHYLCIIMLRGLETMSKSSHADHVTFDPVTSEVMKTSQTLQSDCGFRIFNSLDLTALLHIYIASKKWKHGRFCVA